MEYVKLGTIIGSFGLDGTLKLISTTDFSFERYKQGNQVYLNDEKMTVLTVKSFRNNGKFDFLSVEEISTPEEAQALKGKDIIIKKDEATLPEDYYSFNDLETCDVYDEDDNYLGKVVHVEEYPAQETLRVRRKNQKDFFVPFVKFFIKNVDIKNKKITIHVIEGML